ncbi:MAG: aldo/keto reductase family oxidoreductase [Ruminococcaceae bacterium]|nr:aldo/keto reductase family oxidoreductase [Oscillospiraceae bacterium]
MKYIKLEGINTPVSQIGLGCMRLNTRSQSEVRKFIDTALDLGYNFFDHADIYGGGECEELFGNELKNTPSLRNKMIIQTKCGIRKGMYDFSKEHILNSVDSALKRLNTEKIDILLLHRPDILMDPDEVAEAFDKLEASGKVTAFGVSNHSPFQIELLQKALKQKIIVNQMQLSLQHATMLSAGANVNISFHDGGIDRDGGIRDYMRLKGITLQPWSPLQNRFERKYVEDTVSEELSVLLKEMAEKYSVTVNALLIAWLLKLPENAQPIIGSTSPVHITEIAKATEFTLSREDWYLLYRTAGYNLP